MSATGETRVNICIVCISIFLYEFRYSFFKNNFYSVLFSRTANKVHLIKTYHFFMLSIAFVLRFERNKKEISF